MTGDSAKAVAWQYRWAGVLPAGGKAAWKESSEAAYCEQPHAPEIEYRALVDQDDHESALAEADARYAGLYAIYRNKIDERERLLAGLEALAGEMKARTAFVNNSYTVLEGWIDQIATLTNSAKGGE